MHNLLLFTINHQQVKALTISDCHSLGPHGPTPLCWESVSFWSEVNDVRVQGVEWVGRVSEVAHQC